MPISFHPRGRVEERNSLGPAYYAALYEDEPLEPGVFTEATMPELGPLSYPDPLGDAAGQDATSLNPIFASSFDTEEAASIDHRSPRFSGVDIDAPPDTRKALARGILTEAPMSGRGVLSYLGAFDDAVERDDVAAHPVFVSNFDTDAPPFMDSRRVRLPNTDFGADPDAGDARNSSVRVGDPTLYTGTSTYFGQFGDTAEPETAATHPIPASRLVQGVDTDAATATNQAIAPGEHNRDSPAVLSPMGDVYYLASANDPALPWKSAIGRAGFAESFIPFWGPGRDLLADIEERDYVGAAINSGLLVADAFTFAVPPVNLSLKAAVVGAKTGGLVGGLKGGLKGAAYAIRGPILRENPSHAQWKHVRKTMGQHGWFDWGEQGHHWLFPQRWRWVPAWVRNHPLNIKRMRDPTHNYRIEGPYGGMPEFTLDEKLWYGMPGWAKVLAGQTIVGRPTKAEYYHSGRNGKQKNDRPALAVSGPGTGPGTGTQ